MRRFLVFCSAGLLIRPGNGATRGKKAHLSVLRSKNRAKSSQRANLEVKEALFFKGMRKSSKQKIPQETTKIGDKKRG